MTQTPTKKRRLLAMRQRERETLLQRGRVRLLLSGLRIEQTADEQQMADAVLRRNRRRP